MKPKISTPKFLRMQDFWIFKYSIRLLRRIFLLIIRWRSPDPLNVSGNSFPFIDVVIPVATKDLFLLSLVLNSLDQHCKNPIRTIHLVTPEIDNLKKYLNDSRIKVYSDSNFLNIDNSEFPKHLRSRKGWFTQQAIKLHSISHSSSPYILWIDSDTILNQDRVFVSNDTILELLSDELHQPYFKGMNQILDFPLPKVRFSRISHHNIACVDCFNRFTTKHGICSAQDWLTLMDDCVRLPDFSFADYELCGYVHQTFRHSRIKAYWWNESREIVTSKGGWLNPPHDRSTKYFRPQQPYSLSFHSWRRENDRLETV